MDKLSAMRVFVEVADSGSMTAAAEHLEMSRAMVSRYLESLEDWLGVRLLHRTTRRISLTAAGEQGLAHCRNLLTQSKELQHSLQQTQTEPAGVLRITASNSLAQSQLAALIADYVQLYPKCRIDLRASDASMNLVEERIDLAIRISNALDPSLHARKLTTCRSLLCATPTYLQKYGVPITPADLYQHNCLTHSYFGATQWNFEHPKNPCAVDIAGKLTSNEASVLLAACLAHAGIALLPTYLIHNHLNCGQFVSVLTDYNAPRMGIYAVYASARHQSMLCRSFIDFLIGRLADPPYWDV